ncbi:MAG: hypothetical protein Q8P72_06345 [Candidatus Roizmanbacteria bacterium]|nr:hypothetical protein [Candidatus Roizmanbacteria bacterium]
MTKGFSSTSHSLLPHIHYLKQYVIGGFEHDLLSHIIVIANELVLSEVEGVKQSLSVILNEALARHRT